MHDLYDENLDHLTWVSACASQTELCVEVAALHSGGWAMRDSKRPDLPALRFTDQEIRDFIRAAPRIFGLSVTAGGGPVPAPPPPLRPDRDTGPRRSHENNDSCAEAGPPPEGEDSP